VSAPYNFNGLVRHYFLRRAPHLADLQVNLAEVARTGEPESIVKQRICTETGITRFGTVQDVADLVCFMVSARATWLQGATIDLDGGEIPVL
jgi:NAD(P)-dependent dehydrogenase (short-subunit alcohol dehydrogenase family)